jgi:membrane protease subunit HflC
MIYNRMREERLREAEKLRSQGRSEENYILGKLKVKYNAIVAPATKLALQIIGDARAEEAKIKALSFGQDVEFYQFWRTLLAYRTGLNQGTKNAILSTDSQFLKLLSNSSFDKKPKRQ